MVLEERKEVKTGYVQRTKCGERREGERFKRTRVSHGESESDKARWQRACLRIPLFRPSPPSFSSVRSARGMRAQSAPRRPSIDCVAAFPRTRPGTVRSRTAGCLVLSRMVISYRLSALLVTSRSLAA